MDNIRIFVEHFDPEAVVIIIAVLIIILATFEIIKGRSTKSIILSLGIVGTFIGIVYGLFQFKTENVDAIHNSIDGLINGLKTAFVTSIFGMGVSILLSLKDIFFISTKTEEREIDKLNEIIILMRKAQSETSSERALPSTEIRQLGEKIESLKNSIDKSGYSFQKLGDASSNLIEWQKQYQLQISQLNDIMSSYKEVMNSLKYGLTYFNKMTDEIPSGTENIKKATETLNGFCVEIEKFSETMQNSIKGQSQSLNELTQELTGEHKELKDILNSQFQAWSESYMKYVELFTKPARDTSDESQQS